MKSLSEISTFKYAELMGSNKITSAIENIINEKRGAVYLTEEQLEDVFYKIRHKSFNFAAKFSILNLFKKGTIRLIYNEEVKLTVAVPFIKFKMDSEGMGVVINVSNYAKKNNDDTIQIDPLTLYTLMLAGAFSLVEDNNISLLASSGLVEFYSELINSVLNKLINITQVRKEIYKFIFSKFMLIQLSFDELRATESAKKMVDLGETDIETIDLKFPIESYNNLETLIDQLKVTFSDTKNITLGILFDKWMRSYGEASAFAIESVSLFNLLFIALITNANSLINIKVVEKNANRYSSKLTMLFNKMETIVSEMS